MLKYVVPVIYAVRPQMVYDLIRKRMNEVIPLNKLIGVEIVSVGDGVAEARVAFRPEVTNHIGSAHAALIFGVAEAASGGAMSGAFASSIASIRPVAASAQIKFLKVARSSLTAKAMMMGDRNELRNQLASLGKTTADVAVTVTDAEGIEVASMTVNWHITKK